MSKIFKVGIIGTGFGAKVHAPIFSHHPQFEVKAIASVARGNVNDIKEMTGIEQIYTNWREMIEEEDLDLVSIASAPYLHHEMTLAAFEAGNHVLCEKPMAFNADESLAMIKARDKANKLGLINFEWRYLPARLKVKEILAHQKLGKVLHIQYNCIFPGYESSISTSRGWLGQEDKGGGFLGAIGSHMLDTLMWWTGEKISSVYGQLHTYVPQNLQAPADERELRTADDSFQVLGSFSNGTSLQMNLISTARHALGWRLEIVGTEGTLVMTDDQEVLLGENQGNLEPVELSPAAEAPSHFTHALSRYYPAFQPMVERLYLTLLNGDTRDIPTFEDGRNVQLIMDAIRASSKEGQRKQVVYP
ncbi:Gfo/Idh/MocA family protein [Bacillus horti]|uniref:Dehydrogenase n=1 Tax=Caldalkalibacillus horti TaxID=77523 RepID=A0ABT9VZ81_9BACI|nr:Gfo/Idh/MocA family oxidoreductase [Bacillus horti]MDQ0165915.1 putative dehydrogenase [Bacillus horti]